MKIVHLTDVHLDCAEGSVEEAASRAMAEAPGTAGAAVVITGDVATAETFPSLLPEFARGLGGRPVYFVLGNHDAWFGSIEGAKRSARKLSLQHQDITYLPEAGVVALTDKTGLVGVDGWYDGRAGAGPRSSMRLNDWQLIEELKGLHPDRRREVLERRADIEARRARELLTDALASFEHVVFATHVPPFPQASVDGAGRPSDRDALPWYTNVTLGFVLSALAADHPGRRITVLSGHCHGAADVAIAPNLRVVTGKARYGTPSVAGVHEVP